MAECDWAILCDYSFLDVGRKMCLIGVFDRIFAPAVPTAQHQAALALKIVGEPTEHVMFRVEIVRPTGELLATLGGEATLGEAGTGELQLNMAGLPLPDYGLYAFNVFLDDQLTRTAGFSVAKPPETTRSTIQ